MCKLSRLVLALAILSVLLPSSAWAQQVAGTGGFVDEPINPTGKDWIDQQPHMARVIGPPLSKEELDTVLQALWNVQRYTEWGDIRVLDPSQQMSWANLANGGALRMGDFMTLHGSLMFARQHNTFDLATKWEQLKACALGKGDASCAGY